MIDKSTIEVDVPNLPIAASLDEFWLHDVALEWSLADPIVLESEDDIQSKPDWRDGFRPYRHQVENLITFCRNLPVMLLADDVGLGKTISAALILTELMKRRRVNRALVLCPKILCGQWVDELSSKVGIASQAASGHQLDQALRSAVPVVVTTYHSALSRLRSIRAGDFDMLILDEAHKLRNLHGTAQPPKIAQEIHRVLSRRQFKYVLMLTATPMQNRLYDLYSLVDLLTVAKGHQNPFGSVTEFSHRYVADPPNGRKILEHNRERFQRLFRQYAQRTRRVTAKLPFPERHVKMIPLASTTTERAMLSLLNRGLKLAKGFTKINLAVALMSSPWAFVKQLSNMAERDDHYRDLASTAKTLLSRHVGLFAKEQQLLDCIADLRQARPLDWRLVVFTTRRETQKAIGRILNERKIAHGFVSGGQAYQNERSIKALMAVPPEISVLVSTDSGAEGVNLQNANVMINFDLPWNPMVVEQRIGRIQRLRSPHKFASVFNLCLEDSPELHIVGRLSEKLQVISQTVGDIEAILESGFNGSDPSGSFQQQIMELVEKSLEGQNVEVATRQIEESIVEAKHLLARQEQELDLQLGVLDELQTLGPRPPKLSRKHPTVPVRDFVLSTLSVGEAELVATEDGVSEIKFPGERTERWTFDESTHRRHIQPGHFAGLAPKLFVPGRPDFERLVQHWLDRSAFHVTGDEYNADPFIRSWLESESDVEIESISYEPSKLQLRGTATALMSVSNGVDSYEKLIEIAINENVVAGPLPRGKTVSPESVSPGIRLAVQATVSRDLDVIAFVDFYRQRLEDELVKAGDSPQLMRKVTNDFSPAIHCRVVSFQAQSTSEGIARVDWSIDGSAIQSMELHIGPSDEVVFQHPAFVACAETEKKVPSDFLSTCELTGRDVLPHLLAQSEETGRHGLRRLLVQCDTTGKWLFADELFECVISGQKLPRSSLVASAISGLLANKDLIRRCEFTDVTALADELANSEISGKLYRKDQRCKSAMSGVAGHVSELSKCEQSGDFVLTEELGISDYSGKTVRADLLSQSELQPHRLGLDIEFCKCQVSKRRLLLDELAKSDASGKLVDKTLLVNSDSSRGRALAEELTTCSVSGRRLLPKEMGRSALSGRAVDPALLMTCAVTGKSVRPDELLSCEFTGASVLEKALARSDISGKWCRIDEIAHSEVSQRRGHRSEFSKCEYTGANLPIDELKPSAITGKQCSTSMLVASEKSGRFGVIDTEEVAICEVTHKTLLTDEVASSCASGKLVDKELLVESDSGNGQALVEELKTCSILGKRLLPNEVGLSAVSGQPCDKSLLIESPVSQRTAILQEMVLCEITSVLVLPDELVQSEISLKHFRMDEAVRSASSGRCGHKSEIHRCEYTDTLIEPDQLGRSDFSGKTALLSILSASEKSGRVGVRESGELIQCNATQRWLLADEVAESDVSHQMVDMQLLLSSDSGSGHALREELLTCAYSGRRLLPNELMKSASSDRLIERSQMMQSSLSGKRAAPDEVGECEFTGTMVLLDELEVSEVSGRSFRFDQSARSDESGVRGHLSEFGKCEYSGKFGLHDELAKSDVTGKACLRTLLVASAKSGRTGVASSGESTVCEMTGKVLLVDEVGKSAVSGRTVDKEMLSPSTCSRIVAAQDELVQCSTSKKLFLPNELGHCSQTQQLHDRRLLSTSHSGKRGLKSLMLRCELTGNTAFADELVRCSSTGRRVITSRMATCDLSGACAADDQFGVSDVSGRKVLKRFLVPTRPYRQICASDEVFDCPWGGYTAAKQGAFTCDWTALHVSPEFRGRGPRLAPLESMLASQEVGEGGEWLADVIEKQQNGALRGLTQVRFVRSPSGKLYAVLCQMEKMFGLTTRLAAFVMRMGGGEQKIVGRISFFKVVNNQAVTTKQIDTHCQSEYK